MLKCSSMAAAVRPASARRALIRASAASAASRSPGVAAPANRASILRSRARSCSSDVMPPACLPIGSEVLAPHAHPGQFDRRSSGAADHCRRRHSHGGVKEPAHMPRPADRA